MRLGILGGTFDPIHKGHILMAKTALSALGLDKVLFIPAGDPYFKSGLRNVSLAVHRLNMTKLAIEGEPAFEASDMEIAREGQTYTSDTLKELSEKYDIPPARTASLLDLFTSAPQGITPYAGQLLAIGGLASISPMSVVPFVFYSWLMFVFGFLFIAIGFPKSIADPNYVKAEKKDKAA